MGRGLTTTTAMTTNGTTMTSCFKCGAPVDTTDAVAMCRACDQAAALKVFGDDCPHCFPLYEFDADGRFSVMHLEGCPTFEEFADKVRAIEEGLQP